jgi:uncharacterized protein (DUF885 family)
MRIDLGAAACLVLAIGACGASQAARTTAPAAASPDAAEGVRSPALAALLRANWERRLREDPFFATMVGDDRFDDSIPDLSPRGIARRRAHLARELAEGRALAGSIDASDRTTHRLFLAELESATAMQVCEEDSWKISAMSNLVVAMSQLAHVHRITDRAHATSYLARVSRFSELFDQHLANLRAGAERGLVATHASLERVLALIDETLASPVETWPAATIALDGAAGLEPTVRGTFRDELLAHLDRRVRPAIARYAAGLRADVLPRSRDAAHEGISHLPDGGACYAASILHYTTDSLAAEEIFALGEREVARTDRALIELGSRALGTATLAEVVSRLRSDPGLGYPSGDAILEDARARLADAQARAPDHFLRVPTIPCEVVAIPSAEAAGSGFAYYMPGTEDGSRPGIFFVNTSSPETRRRYMLGALVAHEAIPGHHFQLSFAHDLPDMPAFRRHGLFIAYNEGWGLYAERLADEMSLYRDDLDRLGAADFDAFRSARLVVDTGLHTRHWTRAQAIAYLETHTSMPLDLIASEVDRYLGWPGQALAYKIGQLELLALRERAERELGDRFERRAFHDRVLGVGAVTLPILRDVVTAWIDEVRAARAR